MRKVFAVSAALIGGYLLWAGIRLRRAFLILEDKSLDGATAVIASVLVAVDIAFLAPVWRLFGDPRAGPASVPSAGNYAP